MLDKSELESLLVKLRLGTLSIEDAIGELESNFSMQDDRKTVWERLSCPFSQVLECSNLPINHIEKTIKEYQHAGISFICINLSEEKISYLSSKTSGCDVIFDAGMIKCIKENKGSIAQKNINIFSTLPKAHKVIRELEEMLNIFHIHYNFFYEEKDIAVSTGILENRLSKSDCNIIAGSSQYLIDSISMISDKPIIILPTGDNVISNYGTLQCRKDSGFDCAMAVLRSVR